MTRICKRILGLSAVLCATTCMTSVAHAQSIPAPPVRSSIDANGVDVSSGTFYVGQPSISIGQAGAGGLDFHRTYVSSAKAWASDYRGTINSSNPGSTADGTVVVVSFDGGSESFTLSGGVYTPNEGQASVLTRSGSTYIYTAADGTTAAFSMSLAAAAGIDVANEARVTQITRPTGEQLTFTYTYIPQGSANAPVPWYRLQAVSNNLGYQIHLTYDDSGGAYSTSQTVLTKVTAINTAVDYCDPTLNVCAGLTQTWPSLTYSSNGLTVTDALQRQTTYADNLSASTFTVVRPSGGTTTYSYDTSNHAKSVSNGVGSWTYVYATSNGVLTTTTTDPLSHTRSTNTDLTYGTVSSEVDSLGRGTSYQYDIGGHLTAIIYPEGGSLQYQYNSRNDLIAIKKAPKPGWGSPVTVFSAGYDAACSNPVICNKPIYIRDALGNQTDYTYDPTHGGVLTATQPAPTAGAVRPQTRYTYGALNAYIKNGSGGLVPGPAVYRLTETSTCATTSSCAGTSDEITTTTMYGGTGVANNLLPTSQSVGSGGGAPPATSSVSYDQLGDVATYTSPLAGGAQITTYRYDSDREVVGVVGPDPDGTGPLKNRAIRITYNGDGQVTLSERGTVSSPSDADWAKFSVIDQSSVSYDTVGRPVQTSLIVGGATVALKQQSYDAANRLDCTTLRMNPSVFGSSPAACTLGATGANGPDRITRNSYDASDELVKVTTGYGTPQARDLVSYVYSQDGYVTAVLDGMGNRTTYSYDGFDRLIKIAYPIPTSGSVSSSVDYESFVYDLASHVTQDRRRDNSTVNFAYDALGRLTAVTPPAGQSVISFGYDNLGRKVSAATSASASASGQTATWTYDALGRELSEQGVLGGVGYQYDLAGRRTRMTWPDGLYVSYDYDLANELTAIRENGAASGVGVLASFGYDDLGRRTALSRGNGTSSAYSYDSASNLTTVAHTLNGTGNDQTLNLTYNAAGQVLTRSSSNGSYTWSGAYNVDRAYAVNGQNQVTSSGAASLSYDGRGNLSSDGTTSYGYDALNRLTSAGAVTLSYDPAGRLYQTTSSGTTTRFLYDGVNLIGEFDGSGTLLRRFVHGAGADEPLAWYEGAGVSDRRWLIADDLGTVIGVTNASGVPTTINTYDDYGNPGTGNGGRFQFAGQAWVPEIGLYHDKARAYSPTLGRFLQSDPIGYGDGPNFYAYVHGDPIDSKDPLGLDPPTRVGGVVVTGERPPTPEEDQLRLSLIWLTHAFDGGAGVSGPGAGPAGGGGGGDKACPSPPISPAEAAAAREGDRKSFWTSRYERGDPMAGTALSVVNNTGFLGVTANDILLGAIMNRDGETGNWQSDAQMHDEVQQIGVELMRAQVNAVNTFGSPSAAQIAAYHYQVFNAHGLPNTTFGGSPLTGTGIEATATRTVWMRCQ